MRILKILAHLCAWLGYTACAIVVHGYENNIKSHIYETIISYAIGATVFYIHAELLLPSFLDKKRYLGYSLFVILLFLYNFSVRYAFAFIIDPVVFDTPSSLLGCSTIKLSLIFGWYAVTFLLFSSGYWFFRKQIKMQKDARQREREIAERDKLMLENAALRAQINPHFLFNTLDSFRIKARTLLPQLSESLFSLIELLRSAISKPDEDGMIAIEKEVKIMESMIHIYQSRYPKMFLHYEKQITDQSGFRVPQHVLLSFIENMFKHGAYSDPTKQLRIELTVSNSELKLYTYNKKSNRIKDNSHGIGMSYIKRQLEHNYPESYSLQVAENTDEYSVELKIKSL